MKCGYQTGGGRWGIPAEVVRGTSHATRRHWGALQLTSIQIKKVLVGTTRITRLGKYQSLLWCAGRETHQLKLCSKYQGENMLLQRCSWNLLKEERSTDLPLLPI
jgi:hypothetical protein